LQIQTIAAEQRKKPPENFLISAEEVPLIIQKEDGSYFMNMTDAGIRYFYAEMETRNYQTKENRDNLKKMIGRVAVISQCYFASIPEKREEMLSSLQTNLLSPFIYKIFLLQESENQTVSAWLFENLAVPETAHGPKLEILSIGDRLSFEAAFDFANTEIQKESEMIGYPLIAAVANVDNILTSPTLANLNFMLDNQSAKTIVYLSRSQTFSSDITDYSTRKNRPGYEGDLCFNFIGSADVFLFVPPIEFREAGANMTIYLGTIHIEQLLAVQISSRMPDWSILNMCRFVETFHNHRLRTPETGSVIRLSLPRREQRKLIGMSRLFNPKKN